jgi:hypothetical protein
LVIGKLKTAFSFYFLIAPHIPKIARYELGRKVEQSFITTLEMVHQAIFAPPEKKIYYIESAITRLDTLSFFLQIIWENKFIKDDKYLILSKQIFDIGKDLGGWKKFTEAKLAQNKTSDQSTRKKYLVSGTTK